MALMVASLMIGLQIKHCIGDYILQNQFTLQKNLPSWQFIVPLLMHSAIHAILTLIVFAILAPALWWMCIVDFISHFCIDRLKDGTLLAQFKDKKDANYWRILGCDQLLHNLCYIGYVYLAIM